MDQLSFFEIEGEFRGLKIKNNDVTIDSNGNGYYKGKNIGEFRIRTREVDGWYSYGWHTSKQGEGGPAKDIQELQIMFDRVIETAIKEFERR